MANKELLKQYKKERTRIKRLSTYYQHKGYQFNLEDILPPVPKRITEGSVRRLQKITSERIKNKATISITANNEETALAIVQPEEKQEEIRWMKRVYNPEGKGMLIGMGNGILPDSSLENIEAALDAIFED